ncbi:MAG TPA: (2Fe-2S) ferredoxin domain-containing protein [Magnetospirillaceae bacterium]|nr:(2Fe-2S) ferredoxin domain-containing protein [Magnetospirillaceae bacterium]
MTDASHEICICMGSSCFIRGNSVNVRIIRDFLADHGLDDTKAARIELTGTLCGNRCTEGPIVLMDGIAYLRVTPTTLQDLLEQHLLPREPDGHS